MPKVLCKFCTQEKKIVGRGYCKNCYGRWLKTGSPEYKRKGIRNICEVEDCDKFVVSHGLCDKHRQRLTAHGHLEPTRAHDWGDREKHPLYSVWRGLKRFRGLQLCDRWSKNFWDFVEDVTTRPSKNHYFRPIDEDAEISQSNYHWVERATTRTEDQKAHLREWSRKDRQLNPKKYKSKMLMKAYGITLEEFELMQTAQDNKCAICGEPEKAKNPKNGEIRSLAVDHCHDTGKVRGLLCSCCNVGIGGLKDSIQLLEKALNYLKKHQH